MGLTISFDLSPTATRIFNNLYQDILIKLSQSACIIVGVMTCIHKNPDFYYKPTDFC